MATKQEEIHRYLPCTAILRCDHCSDSEERDELTVEDGPEQPRPGYLGEIGLEVALEELDEPKEDAGTPLRGFVGRLAKKVRKLKSKHF